MNDNDRETMVRFGITAETRTVFHYEGHRYERLSDAVNYAKIQSTTEPAEPAATPASNPAAD